MLKIDFNKYKGLTGRDIHKNVLADIGMINRDVVILGADAITSGGGDLFKEKFSERTFDFGIAEPNMVGAAAGLALMNRIPVVLIYGFIVSRIAEQVRNDICYNNKNVKIICQTSTFDMTPGGATHHGIEDVSILKNFPNITIIQPATPLETIAAAYYSILENEGPVYLRFSRNMKNELYQEKDFKFEIGKAITVKEGHDITIIGTGIPLHLAVKAAESLESEGISVRVIDIHTIKPIDEEIIIKAAKETKGIVTVEDMNISGGLGSSVCQIVANNKPTKVKHVGLIYDKFSVIGNSVNELYNYYGITEDAIIQKAKEILV